MEHVVNVQIISKLQKTKLNVSILNVLTVNYICRMQLAKIAQIIMSEATLTTIVWHLNAFPNTRFFQMVNVSFVQNISLSFQTSLNVKKDSASQERSLVSKGPVFNVMIIKYLMQTRRSVKNPSVNKEREF